MKTLNAAKEAETSKAPSDSTVLNRRFRVKNRAGCLPKEFQKQAQACGIPAFALRLALQGKLSEAKAARPRFRHD